MVKLKNCPFCGKTDCSIKVTHAAFSEDRQHAHVICNSCLGTGPGVFYDGDYTVDIKNEAIEKWNNRLGNIDSGRNEEP